MNNTRLPKRPAFLFYTGDWLKAPDLRACSLAARGLWMDALCLMFESAEPGYLRHSTGRPVSTEQIARMTGCAVSEAEQLLQELADAGVLSRADDGAIYCRRMVRDERKRLLCSEAGKRGGNPTLKGDAKGDANPPVNPPLNQGGWQGVGGTLGTPEGAARPSGDGSADEHAQPAQTDPTLKGGPKGDAKGGSKRNPTPSVSGSVSSNTAHARGNKRSSKPHPQAVCAFCDPWEEMYGEKYPFDGGKDGKAIKEMLGHVNDDVEKFSAAAKRYFADADEFVKNARHSLALFRSQFVRWLVPGPTTPKPYHPPAGVNAALARAQTGEVAPPMSPAPKRQPAATTGA